MELLKHKPNKRIEDFVFSTNAVLGKGSSGTVYLGRHDKTKEIVAIKVIDTKKMKNDVSWKNLNSEIQTMGSLDSENIVKFLGVFQTTNNTYLITEYCNQGDLRNLMNQRKIFPEKEAINIIKQILLGVLELQKKGIIHRDLKPANVLLHNNVFKITDFGFARKLNDEEHIMDSLVGTPLYMSPQILTKQSYNSKTEIWSIALIFYEMLYGTTPWPSQNLVELVNKIQTQRTVYFNPQIPISSQTKHFIQNCLVHDQNKRFGWKEVYNHPLFNIGQIEREKIKKEEELELLKQQQEKEEREEQELQKQKENLELRYTESKIANDNNNSNNFEYINNNLSNSQKDNQNIDNNNNQAYQTPTLEEVENQKLFNKKQSQSQQQQQQQQYSQNNMKNSFKKSDKKPQQKNFYVQSQDVLPDEIFSSGRNSLQKLSKGNNGQEEQSKVGNFDFQGKNYKILKSNQKNDNSAQKDKYQNSHFKNDHISGDISSISNILDNIENSQELYFKQNKFSDNYEENQRIIIQQLNYSDFIFQTLEHLEHESKYYDSAIMQRGEYFKIELQKFYFLLNQSAGQQLKTLTLDILDKNPRLKLTNPVEFEQSPEFKSIFQKIKNNLQKVYANTTKYTQFLQKAIQNNQIYDKKLENFIQNNNSYIITQEFTEYFQKCLQQNVRLFNHRLNYHFAQKHYYAEILQKQQPQQQTYGSPRNAQTISREYQKIPILPAEKKQVQILREISQIYEIFLNYGSATKAAYFLDIVQEQIFQEGDTQYDLYFYQLIRKFIYDMDQQLNQ